MIRIAVTAQRQMGTNSNGQAFIILGEVKHSQTLGAAASRLEHERQTPQKLRAAEPRPDAAAQCYLCAV